LITNRHLQLSKSVFTLRIDINGFTSVSHYEFLKYILALLHFQFKALKFSLDVLRPSIFKLHPLPYFGQKLELQFDRDNDNVGSNILIRVQRIPRFILLVLQLNENILLYSDLVDFLTCGIGDTWGL
jgi:hypothetical protein